MAIFLYYINYSQTKYCFTHLTLKTLETKTTSTRQDNKITQVANSKGTEWMVSSYYTWQQQCNQNNLSLKSNSTSADLANRFTLKETQQKSAISFAIRLLVLILGAKISM